MKQGKGRGVGWKLFAAAMAFFFAVGDLPKLLHPHSLGTGRILLIATYLVAVAGIIAYAFGRQVFATRFWRLFAPVFCLVTAAQIGAAMPTIAWLLYGASGSLPIVLGLLIAFAPVVAMALLTCLALLRQGQLLGPERRPWGRPPEQLALPLG
jgi:hypothetical protein